MILRELVLLAAVVIFGGLLTVAVYEAVRVLREEPVRVIREER